MWTAAFVCLVREQGFGAGDVMGLREKGGGGGGGGMVVRLRKGGVGMWEIVWWSGVGEIGVESAGTG